MKTPEEMAAEFAKDMWWRENGYRRDAKEIWLAGYKAAQDHNADASKMVPDGPRFVGKTVPIFAPPEEEK